MSVRLSTFSSSAALALALVVSLPRTVHAQACCAGIGAVTPARLLPHEIALVGLTVKGAASLGGFDGTGQYWGEPKGGYGVDFEQDLFAALRVLNRGEIAVMAPLLESRRVSPSSAGATSDVGYGIGDVNLSARGEITHTTYGSHVPGVAILAGMTFPTGRSVFSPAASVLAANVTGVGAYQLNVGLAAEETIGTSWVLSASQIFGQRLPTTSAGIRAVLAPQWTTLLALSYVFDSGVSLGGSATFVTEAAGTMTSALGTMPGSPRRSTTASLFVSVPISDRWRFQASAYNMLPIDKLGENQSTVPLGLTATIIKSWL